jgi:hypothetical protein
MNQKAQTLAPQVHVHHVVSHLDHNRRIFSLSNCNHPLVTIFGPRPWVLVLVDRRSVVAKGEHSNHESDYLERVRGKNYNSRRGRLLELYGGEHNHRGPRNGEKDLVRVI